MRILWQMNDQTRQGSILSIANAFTTLIKWVGHASQFTNTFFCHARRQMNTSGFQNLHEQIRRNQTSLVVVETKETLSHLLLLKTSQELGELQVRKMTFTFLAKEQIDPIRAPVENVGAFGQMLHDNRFEFFLGNKTSSVLISQLEG